MPVVTRPPEADIDERTLDERVAELEALIEEARQRARRRRRRNVAVVVAVALAAGAALQAGGDGVRLGSAQSSTGDARRAAAVAPVGSWMVPTGPPGFSGEVVLHPTRPAWLYLRAGGRVYRSTNGGRSWKSGPPLALKLTALAVDPRNGSIIYAGTNDGVLKSTDAGRTWRWSGLRPSPGRSREYADTEGWVYSIAVDPTDSSNVFAVTRGLATRVLSRSHDGGTTWHAVRRSTSRTVIEIHAARSGILYAAGLSSGLNPKPAGVLRSTDGGTTWRGVLGGSWSVAVDPDRAGTVWAVGELGVRVTRDGGTTWRSPGPAPAGASAIVLDPRRPGTLYLSTGQNRVYRSVDGGRTWRAFGTKAQPGSRSHLTELVAVDPRTPGTLYAGDGSGLVATVDGGTTWRRADAGVVASQVASIAPAASNPTTIYAGGLVSKTRAGVWYPVGAALSRSDDRGRTWTALQIDGTDGVTWQQTDGRTLAVDPRDDRHVLVGGRGRITGSRDGGATWKSRLRLAAGDWAYAIAFAPSDPRQVYALVYTAAEERSRLIRSSDGGATWTMQGGAGVENMRTLAVDPKNAETVYAIYEGTAQRGAGVATSSDGGRSWRYRSIPADNGDDVTPTSIAIAPSDPETLYVATFRGIARSVDGGDSWQLLPHPELASFPLTVVVDPLRSETVYVGKGDDGVLRSIDGGATWQPFGTGLPRRDVQTLAFDASGTWLYAGLGDAGLTSIRVR